MLRDERLKMGLKHEDSRHKAEPPCERLDTNGYGIEAGEVGFHTLLLPEGAFKKLRPGVVSAAASSKLPYR
jgi:hypothetical protein